MLLTYRKHGGQRGGSPMPPLSLTTAASNCGWAPETSDADARRVPRAPRSDRRHFRRGAAEGRRGYRRGRTAYTLRVLALLENPAAAPDRLVGAEIRVEAASVDQPISASSARAARTSRVLSPPSIAARI